MSDDAIITNRQARRDYFILEVFEAGIELKGSEIKSIRQRLANLKDGFARIEKGEVFLYNLHITPYEFARRDESEPKRARKLLLRKSEIKHLFAKVSEKSLTLIPLKIYFKNSFAKVELAVAKGKKLYDKRDSVKKRDAKLEIDRAMHGKRR
ncbi:MAG: SsrA-binding protein SmpB [Candidatus Omnitrophota bacterium]